MAHSGQMLGQRASVAGSREFTTLSYLPITKSADQRELGFARSNLEVKLNRMDENKVTTLVLALISPGQKRKKKFML